MFSAEIKHFLRFTDAADHRSGERTAVADQREGVNGQRICRCADINQCTIQRQQRKEGIDVNLCAYGIDDQVEGAGELFKGIFITCSIIVVCPQLQAVLFFFRDCDSTVTSAPIA